MTEITKLPSFTIPIIANSTALAYSEIARISNVLADKNLTCTMISQVNAELWVASYHAIDDYIVDHEHRSFIHKIEELNTEAIAPTASPTLETHPSEDIQGEAAS